MSQIITNTPLWAWFVLAGLIVLGGLQTRPRRLSRATILILPVVMPVFSLFSVAASFSMPAGFGAWAAGAVAALLLNGLLLRSPDNIRYDATTARFELPGSWTPLALMMIIYCTRFATIATTAVNPALASSSGFVLSTSAMLGFLAGMFVSRALVILSAAGRAVTAPA